MEDWSDTPIYAQMMAEQEERRRLEEMRVLNPIYVQVIEETKQKEKLMEHWQAAVLKMREAMELPNPERPRTLSPAEAALHIRMIRDEFEKEFVPAFEGQDLVEMYDAGIDVIVYVIGAMCNAGFDIDPGFREIMRSNMSKFDPETGKAIKAGPNDPSGEPEGKVLKGPAYSPPALHNIINETFRFGAEDNTVYRTSKTPITLGVGGEKIGEGDIHMDHNGNVTLDGIIWELEFLPQVDGLSIYSAEDVPEAEVVKVYDGNGDHIAFVDPRVIAGVKPVPEGWPDPLVDDSMLEGVDEEWMEKGPTIEDLEEDARPKRSNFINIINIDEISPSETFQQAGRAILRGNGQEINRA